MSLLPPEASPDVVEAWFARQRKRKAFWFVAAMLWICTAVLSLLFPNAGFAIILIPILIVGVSAFYLWPFGLFTAPNPPPTWLLQICFGLWTAAVAGVMIRFELLGWDW